MLKKQLNTKNLYLFFSKKEGTTNKNRFELINSFNHYYFKILRILLLNYFIKKIF